MMMSNCMECGVTVYFEESPSYDVCAETGDKYCDSHSYDCCNGLSDECVRGN